MPDIADPFRVSTSTLIVSLDTFDKDTVTLIEPTSSNTDASEIAIVGGRSSSSITIETVSLTLATALIIFPKLISKLSDASLIVSFTKSIAIVFCISPGAKVILLETGIKSSITLALLASNAK